MVNFQFFISRVNVTKIKAPAVWYGRFYIFRIGRNKTETFGIYKSQQSIWQIGKELRKFRQDQKTVVSVFGYVLVAIAKN